MTKILACEIGLGNSMIVIFVNGSRYNLVL